MSTGFAVVHRLTQAEFNSSASLVLSGGLIEIVDAYGNPLGPIYATGLPGAQPMPITGTEYRIASEIVTAFSVVYDVDGEHCLLASSGDTATAEQILGLTLTSAAIGETVQIFSTGVYSGNTGFSAGPLFLGIHGNVTHGPAASGVHVQVGYAVNSTTSIISVQRPVYIV